MATLRTQVYLIHITHGTNLEEIKEASAFALINQCCMRCAKGDIGMGLNAWHSFSAPEAVLNEAEQRFDCLQAQTHM